VKPYQRDNSIYAGNSDSNKKSHTDADQRETWWQWTTKDPTGLYTFCVAIVTGALVVVVGIQAGLFVWQLRLIRESIGDAKVTANAAAAAATAAQQSIAISQREFVAVHRPRIILSPQSGSGWNLLLHP
ncbi:MAG: hypothetical protein WB608_14520, partial [Terracidiphilus sp.]